MSPAKAKQHCDRWIALATASAVALLISGILFFTGWIGDHRWYIDLIITVGILTVCLWSVWIVIILKSIANWWVNILHQVDHISNNLADACNDIKQIKKEIK